MSREDLAFACSCVLTYISTQLRSQHTELASSVVGQETWIGRREMPRHSVSTSAAGETTVEDRQEVAEGQTCECSATAHFERMTHASKGTDISTDSSSRISNDTAYGKASGFKTIMCARESV